MSPSPAARKTTRKAREAASKAAPNKIKAEKKISADIIKKAAGEGLLPHEILLKAARGEPFIITKLVIILHKSGPKRGKEKRKELIKETYYPSFNEQIECARSAAPYFAPRLATQLVKTDEKTADALTGVMKQLASKLPG